MESRRRVREMDMVGCIIMQVSVGIMIPLG